MPSETALTVISGGGCFTDWLAGIDTPACYRRLENECLKRLGVESVGHEKLWAGRRERRRGFVFAISRDGTVQPLARVAMSTTQYSTMPARAYSSVFVVRSKPKAESEISTTRRRSAGRGLAAGIRARAWRAPPSRVPARWLGCLQERRQSALPGSQTVLRRFA